MRTQESIQREITKLEHELAALQASEELPPVGTILLSSDGEMMYLILRHAAGNAEYLEIDPFVHLGSNWVDDIVLGRIGPSVLRELCGVC